MVICSSTSTQSQLTRTKPRQLLRISKERDSTISLGNLCQCSVTLMVKKCFFMFLCVVVCASWLLSCHWAPLESSVLFALSLRYLHALVRFPPQPSLPMLNCAHSFRLSSTERCSRCLIQNHRIPLVGRGSQGSYNSWPFIGPHQDSHHVPDSIV